MTSTNRYVLTPEQLALSEKRKEQKLKAKEAPKADLVLVESLQDKSRIVAREWVQLAEAEGPVRQGVKVLTWNLLAQCLVRRELFPTSNCLKATEREHMIYREILEQKADVITLQEVDRLEKLLPVLEKAGYTHHFAAGPGKKHGLLIAFNKDRFANLDSRRIQYDEQEVRDDEDGIPACGISFKTRNIANLVALQDITDQSKGLIVATTHLFWHPQYTYERTRQAGILVREVLKFRHDVGHSWPCIIAGDFNFTPDDPAYSLLVGDPLLSAQEHRLSISRVVHVSVDPTVPVTTKAMVDEGDEGASADPDKVITNARSALPADGLLSDSDLSSLFARGAIVRSAYDEGLRSLSAAGSVAVYSDRVPVARSRHGACEPEWTSYTHYWKTVLDYIFVLDPKGSRSVITGILKPHRTEDLVPGLPQKGVCGSDHVSLCAELAWTESAS